MKNLLTKTLFISLLLSGAMPFNAQAGIFAKVGIAKILADKVEFLGQLEASIPEEIVTVVKAVVPGVEEPAVVGILKIVLAMKELAGKVIGKVENPVRAVGTVGVAHVAVVAVVAVAMGVAQVVDAVEKNNVTRNKSSSWQSRRNQRKK